MDFYAILDQVIDVLRQRQREQARTALSTAIEMYQSMAMPFWLPQAQAALAQVEER